MEVLWLVFAAMICSAISGITGLGGGTILIMLMSLVMPVPFLIPAHGVIQLSSNLSRVYLNRNAFHFKIFFLYTLGAVFGAVLGTRLNINISQNVFAFGVGSFVLLSVWLPLEKITKVRFLRHYEILGFVSTFASLFVGVTGPLVHPFLLKEKRFSRFSFIATEAGCVTMTHFLKIIVFGFLGVSLASYWKTLSMMVLASFIGSYVGKQLLCYVKENHFRTLLRVLLTVLALKLIYVCCVSGGGI